MNTEAKGDVLSRSCTIDNEAVRVLDSLFIAITGGVPHDYLVTRLDGLSANLGVGKGGTAHVRQRRLIADDLGYHARDQVRVLAQLPILIRVLIKEPNSARNRIARGVVTADAQQNDVSEKLLRIHVSRRR